MKIVVVGTGYVGLVSGVCLATVGHDVTCVDLRAEVVESLNAGKPHIHEKGLPELLAKVLAAKRFHATLNLETALQNAAMVLVAVGTPSKDGRIDLSFIRDVSAQIGSHLKTRKDFLSVVVKSTVVPSTTDTIVLAALEKHSGLKLGQFGLGMNPEFLREGDAIEDFMQPDRVVLGFEDATTRALLEEAYAPWQCDKLFVNTRTAETIKYTNNALLATQISAVNEIANLCYALGGIDVQEVMQGVHLDKRWSPVTEHGRIYPEILTYLIPGCGFGGSCFPKDVQALRTQGQDQGLPMRMLQAVLDVNDDQPSQMVRQLEKALGSLNEKRILILGLAFKPGTDDVRESASLRAITQLVKLGAIVSAHDPIAADNARVALSGVAVTYVSDWQDALGEADGVIVATKWQEYNAIKQPLAVQKLSGKVLIDARRMFHPSDFTGADYHTIGWRIAS